MQLIGFNLTKVYGERFPNFTKAGINNNVEFTNIEKDKIDMLKDLEALKISFRYSLLYGDVDKPENTKPENKQGELFFEGSLLLSATKDEAKEFHKSWKTKEVPQTALTTLYNIILRKCSTKAVTLQEDLNLPSPYLKVPILTLQEKTK